MDLRRPLGQLVAVGSLGWPVAYLGFGGPATDGGVAIIGVGSLVVLTAVAAELVLRARQRRQHRPRV